MSTIFFCSGSSGRLDIVDMLAVTFVFTTSGFPPFVLLTRLCHGSHVRPLLDFRLRSYEPYRKFPTYFVGVFCSNLECKFPIYISEIYDIFCRLLLFQLRVYFVVYIYIGNFRYISEIYDIFCRLFLFQLRVYVVAYIYTYIYIGQISL